MLFRIFDLAQRQLIDSNEIFIMFSTVRTVLGVAASSNRSARATRALFARTGCNDGATVNLALFVGSFTSTFRAHFPECASWLQPARAIFADWDNRCCVDIPTPRREECTRARRLVAAVQLPPRIDAAMMLALAKYYRALNNTDEAPVPDRPRAQNLSMVPEALAPHHAPATDPLRSPRSGGPACQQQPGTT